MAAGDGFSVKTVTAAIDFKEQVEMLVKEYFDSADAEEVARILRELQRPLFGYYLVKCAVKSAMDRTERELELAARLLGHLCDDVLEPSQVSKGFVQLLETAQDQSLDVPDTPAILALFLVRASIDDILPHAFLKVCAGSLHDEMARSIVKEAQGHLARRDVEDWALHVWGTPSGTSVDDAKRLIADLVSQFAGGVAGMDAVQAGLHSLALPFYHHEFVRRAVLTACEEPLASSALLTLLKSLTTSRDLSMSQVSKGLSRVEETLLKMYDEQEADRRFQALQTAARSHGLLEAPSDNDTDEEMDTAASPHLAEIAEPHTAEEVAAFKERACMLIREYLESGSISEARSAVQALLEAGSGRAGEGDRRLLLRHLVRKAVTIALDHDNRAKERVAQLLSALHPLVIHRENVKAGLTDLCLLVEDLKLDIVDAPDEVAVFVARARVDDILAPADLHDISRSLKGAAPAAEEVMQTVHVLLGARHAAERVLRVWGGSSVGTVAHTKAATSVLLQEFKASGDLVEARRCLHALAAPHYTHELVKQALTLAVEDASCTEALFGMLKALASTMEVTTSEMTKGFRRMADSVEDLSLDVPGAQDKFHTLQARARAEGVLE